MTDHEWIDSTFLCDVTERAAEIVQGQDIIYCPYCGEKL